MVPLFAQVGGGGGQDRGGGLAVRGDDDILVSRPCGAQAGELPTPGDGASIAAPPAILAATQAPGDRIPRPAAPR